MKQGLPDPKFWRGRRVLLTGHTGFKGAWAALWLAEMGATVSCVALAPDQTPNLFELAKVGTRVNSVFGDICDADVVRDAVREAKPQIILHLAAQALVRRSYREPAATFASNVMGTVNVLDAARTAEGLEVCLAVTSDKVYENDGTGRAFDESARLGGHDPYSASKAAAEIVVASYRDSFFTGGAAKVATARGGNVIGGGDFSEDRIVPDIWRAHRAGEALILRYPAATRPWQHVLDCLSGYLVYAERLAQGTTGATALNFGPREKNGRTVSELVAAMQGAIGAKAGWKQAEGPQPKEMPALALSCELAGRELGWQSHLDAAQAIEWTASWYKAFAAGEDAAKITQQQIRAFADV
ncbi:MAG: CDP-glucose 4,6-dehydratase [Micropepsaceae bacterium]